jgi:predicted O-methyltransferase YrrM
VSGRIKVSRHAVMAKLIRENDWTRGVELGVWQGSLYGFLLGAFPQLELTGVDRWQAINEYAGKDMAAAERATRAIAEIHKKRARILKMDTAAAAAHFEDQSLDFVFIDASHDTDSVARDVLAWTPKIRAGGALTGHDANLWTVQNALHRSAHGWQLLEANCWICSIGRTHAAA